MLGDPGVLAVFCTAAALLPNVRSREATLLHCCTKKCSRRSTILLQKPKPI